MENPDHLQERMFVLRCQAGDDSAYTYLYTRYHGPLSYYLRRMVNSRESSEDILQNVWIEVIRNIASLREPTAFRAWLYRIAHNEALMWHRKHGRIADWEITEPPVTAITEGDDETPDNADAVHAALAELTPPQREVLVLRFLEDLSYDEIASITGVGVGTVRSRLHYAKRNLRRIVEDHRLCKTKT